MPNHVTNRVVAVGPFDEVHRLVRTCFKDGCSLDFDTLIPMPQDLRDTTDGSYGSIGYEAWYGNPSGLYGYPWISKCVARGDLEALRAFLESESPEYKIQGDKIAENLKKYGFRTWYDWAVCNWGTKWNAYDCETLLLKDAERRSILEFRFNTAWSTPTPVFTEMAKQFPLVEFYTVSFDEGWNFAAVGKYCNDSCFEDTVQANPLLYRVVYGKDCYMFEDMLPAELELMGDGAA